MIVTDLYPVLQDLPKIDKLRILQFLISELAKDEGFHLMIEGQQYPIWTPYHTPDAAKTLLNALNNANDE